MQNTLKIKQTKTALVFNLAIIACEIAAIIIVFFKIGCYPLVYYTEDSNLFALWQAFRCDISKAEKKFRTRFKCSNIWRRLCFR